MASSKITFSHEWTYELESPLHWRLYWHQLNLVLNLSDVSASEKIIEIGIGSGLMSNYLKRKGYNVTTVDIDKNKNPDIVANIIEDDIPISDVYLAFEILEHIPFDAVEKVLLKLKKNKVREIIFSIPHAYKTYLYCNIWLPYIGEKTIHIGRKRKYINTENHHWEIGINGITQQKIDELFKKNNYRIDYSNRYRNHQFYKAKLILE